MPPCLTKTPIICPLLAEACLHIAGNLRPQDEVECAATAPGGRYDAAALAASFACAPFGFIAALVSDRKEIDPVAMVAAAPVAPRVLSVAMVSTRRWPAVARITTESILADLRPVLLAAGYRRAEARSLDGRAVAQGWLARLGFIRECAMPDYGWHGETFHLMAWRISAQIAAEAGGIRACAA